jgi:outer membrane receptor protein involved in Fe transport
MFVSKPVLKKLTLAISLALPFGVYAAEKNVDELDEMVVTATKTERNIRDVTSAVTVIDSDRIEKSVATTADQLLRGVPGVYASRMDASSPNRIAQTYTRGLPGNGRTLVLIDDVPMNVAYDSQVDWSQLGTIDVDRIEVVRGAGSALYGNHAMGGVINVISKAIKPGLKGRVESEYGSMETIREAGIVSYGNDTTGGQISTSYLESDGYNMWRPDITVPKSQQDKTGTRKTNVAGKFSHAIDTSNLLDFNFSYLSDVATGLYTVPDYTVQDREQYLGSARYRHLGETSESTVVLYSRIGRMDADSTDSTSKKILYRGNFDDMENGIRAQTSHFIGTHQKVTFGGQYSDSRMTMINSYPATLGRKQTTDGNIRLSGIFLQDEIGFGPLNINIAGRWDLWQTEGNFIDTDKTVAGQGRWDERSKDSFSPKGGFSYKLTDDLVARGSIGESFNTPDISQMYGNSQRNGVNSFGNPMLSPETAVSSDLGLDYYFGKKAYIKGTLFHTKAEDFIGSMSTNNKLSPRETVKVNYEGVRAQGVEVEGMWKAADFVTLYASYTKTDSIITKFKQNATLQGMNLINIPSDQGNLRADFTLPYGFTAFGAFNYIGDRFSVDNNATKYKEYSTYDFGVTKSLYKDVTARMTFMNIGGDKYEGIGYIAPGATMMGGIVAKF